MIEELSKIRRGLLKMLAELTKPEVRDEISIKDIELYHMAVAELNHTLVLLKLLKEREEESMTEEEGFSEEEGFY